MSKRGLLFILSAPSGVGKSTLAKSIVNKDGRFVLSISYTTRRPRPGELSGRDYFFVSKEQFRKCLNRGALVESALVHGSLYGTPRRFLEKSLRAGKHVILAIDVQGAHSIAKAYPKETVKIFLMPPNFKVWFKRLHQRKESDWLTRVRHAKEEIRHLKSYDYCLVNDHLKNTISDFLAIVRSEELKKQKLKVSVSFPMGVLG